MCIWFALCTIWGHWSLRGTLPATLKAGCCVFGLPGLCRLVMVQTPLGPWSPGDLFLTLYWGMLGAQAWSCESGWAQTGSLGVKKWLGGWRNEGTGGESVSECVYMFTVCTCSFQLTTLYFCLWREQSLPLCAPAGQADSLPFFSPSVLAAFVHLGTQTSSVGVLQAVGVVCGETFSPSVFAARSPSRL